MVETNILSKRSAFDVIFRGNTGMVEVPQSVSDVQTDSVELDCLRDHLTAASINLLYELAIGWDFEFLLRRRLLRDVELEVEWNFPVSIGLYENIGAVRLSNSSGTILELQFYSANIEPGSKISEIRSALYGTILGIAISTASMERNRYIEVKNFRTSVQESVCASNMKLEFAEADYVSALIEGFAKEDSFKSIDLSKNGVASEPVCILQAALNRLTPDIQLKLEIDGIFGDKTKSVLEMHRRKYGSTLSLNDLIGRIMTDASNRRGVFMSLVDYQRHLAGQSS